MELSYALEDINPDNFDLDLSSIPSIIDPNELISFDSGGTTARASSCNNSCYCSSSSSLSSTNATATAQWCPFEVDFSLACSQVSTSSVVAVAAARCCDAEDSGVGLVMNAAKKSRERKQDAAATKKTIKNDKPPEPYADIIAKAILSSHVNLMQLKDIYSYVTENYKEFISRVAPKKWRNAIRHNLSSHRYFMKTTQKDSKGHYWSIKPSLEHELREDLFLNCAEDDYDDDLEVKEKLLATRSKSKSTPKSKKTKGQGRKKQTNAISEATASDDLLNRDQLNFSPACTMVGAVANSELLLNSSVGPSSNISSTTYISSTTSTPTPVQYSNYTLLGPQHQLLSSDSAFFDASSTSYPFYYTSSSVANCSHLAPSSPLPLSPSPAHQPYRFLETAASTAVATFYNNTTTAYANLNSAAAYSEYDSTVFDYAS